MYRSQVVSRSQRRTEKRQVIFFLLLVLGVALGSFVLGVLVGRNLPTVSRGGGEVARLPVVRPLPAPVEAVAPVAAATPHPEATPGPSSPRLSFYDTLPKGEKPPLGSGINISGNPGGAPVEPIVANTPPLSTPSGSESVQRSAPAAKDVESAPGRPEEPSQKPSVAVASTQYYLQVASLPKPEEAQALAKRLQRKGHVASVDQSGGAGKGVWYRIFTGPYASAEEAKKAAERMRSEERLTPILRKR